MQAPLRLNFTQKQTTDLLKFSWAGLLLLLLGLAVLILAWRYHASLLAETSDLQAEMGRIEQVLNKKQPKKQQKPQSNMSPKAMKALQSANQAIEMPWAPLLNTLEETQHQHIALLEIQPDSKKQRVLIAGEAKNYASIIAYIELLEQQAILQDVYLHKHQLSENVAGQPVQFTLGALWAHQEQHP